MLSTLISLVWQKALIHAFRYFIVRTSAAEEGSFTGPQTILVEDRWLRVRADQ